jgi:polyisoprenoid-binding protein YceI
VLPVYNKPEQLFCNMIKLALALLVACSLFFNNNTGKISNTYNYALITDSSVVEWKGSSPKVSHWGSFALHSQGIQVVDGQVISGTFSIPIESITNVDLPKVMKPVLLKHLKSEDFFHSSLFPEATYRITGVDWQDHFAEGAITDANALVNGELTLLGNTHALSFPAKITFNNGVMAVEARFTLDRTKWGMTHAADPALGNRHIFPGVDIHLKVFARTTT